MESILIKYPKERKSVNGKMVFYDSRNVFLVFSGKPLSFIPWLTIKALALVVFTTMVIFEVSVGSGVSR